MIDREKDAFIVKVLSTILVRTKLRVFARLLQVSQVEILLCERDHKPLFSVEEEMSSRSFDQTDTFAYPLPRCIVFIAVST